MKPENYRWYEDNQKKGNFTLYDLGRVAEPRIFFWFNLNKVQPPFAARSRRTARRVGEPFVDPVKYAWFNNPVSGAPSRWRSIATR